MAVWNIINLGEFLGFRFDAECYQPQLLEVEQRVQSLRPVALDTVATVSDGNHLSIAGEFCESGVRYLKGQEVGDFFIDDSNPTFIPESTYENITRAHMCEGDILLSVVGTIGPVGLVTDKYDKLCGSCKLAIIRPHSINPSILAAYLSSETGQALLRRRIRGSVQPGIILPDVRAFPVPPFTDALVKQVDELIKEAQSNLTQAGNYYPEAESEMLERMGWYEIASVPPELNYVANFSELEINGRIDPEYFHPHYSRLRAQIMRRGGLTLGQLVITFRKGTQPETYDENGEIVVLKSKDVYGHGINWDGCDRATLSAWADASARVSKMDVVINMTGRGTLGRAEAITSLPDKKVVAAVDVAICRIDKSQVDPIYLALFLNSPAGLAQSERAQTGSSGQLHLYPQHLRQYQIFVPRNSDGRIDLAWQKSLANKVLEAGRAKDRARKKLEEAKQLVEKAIT